MTANAVGQPPLLAHLLHQARDETAAAKRVVADDQRKKVRITALDGRQAEQHMRLGGRMRNALLNRRGQRPGLRNIGFASRAQRQIRCEVLH